MCIRDSNINEQVATLVNLSQHVYPDSIDGGHYIWDFGDGSPTVNDKNPQHIYQENGNYTITLTAIVCQDTSVHTMPVNVLGVGVEELDNNEAILQISPNPAHNKIRIQHQKSGILQLYNPQGKMLLQQHLNETGQQTIDITHLPVGVYVYEFLVDGRAVENGKLVVVND